MCTWTPYWVELCVLTVRLSAFACIMKCGLRAPSQEPWFTTLPKSPPRASTRGPSGKYLVGVVIRLFDASQERNLPPRFKKQRTAGFSIAPELHDAVTRTEISCIEVTSSSTVTSSACTPQKSASSLASTPSTASVKGGGEPIDVLDSDADEEDSLQDVVDFLKLPQKTLSGLSLDFEPIAPELFLPEGRFEEFAAEEEAKRRRNILRDIKLNPALALREAMSKWGGCAAAAQLDFSNGALGH